MLRKGLKGMVNFVMDVLYSRWLFGIDNHYLTYLPKRDNNSSSQDKDNVPLHSKSDWSKEWVYDSRKFHEKPFMNSYMYRGKGGFPSVRVAQLWKYAYGSVGYHIEAVYLAKDRMMLTCRREES